MYTHMALNFFGHIGHLGLGVCSLSSILNRQNGESNTDDKNDSPIHNSLQMQNIRKFIRQDESKKGAAGMPLLLLRNPQRLLNSLMVEKIMMPQLNEGASNGHLTIVIPKLMESVADELMEKNNFKEQIINELDILLKQYGFVISNDELNGNPEFDENELVAKDEILENLRETKQQQLLKNFNQIFTDIVWENFRVQEFRYNGHKEMIIIERPSEIAVPTMEFDIGKTDILDQVLAALPSN